MDNNKTRSVTNSHIDDEATALYAEAVSRDQQPDLPEEHLVHVEECSQCKDKILDLSIFLRNPDSSSYSLFPDTSLSEISKPRPLNYLRIAALFIMAVLLIGVYLLLFKDSTFIKNDALIPPENNKTQGPGPGQDRTAGIKKNQPKNIVHTGKSKTIKYRNNLTHENYRVNPNLESMIDSKYRSADVEILSPRNNAHLRGEILFFWKGISHSTLTLKIINNKNEVFFDKLIKENKYILKRKFSPGLYYWKLENKNDLLYTGKFFIE